MDAYLPGLPELARDFGVSPSAAQVTVTTYLLGLALGQLLSGPLSDVHGRRRPLVAGMAVFTLTTLACSLAPSLFVLAGMRLVQGTSAAVGVAVGRAIVRDLYAGAAGARYLSRLMIVIGLAPILAPIVGGQLLRFTSWRGVFVALAVLGLALTAIGARLLPETLPRERRRAAGLGITLRTFAQLLADRRFVGFVLIVGLGGGAMIGYVAGSSFVLQDVYGASPQLYGVLFGLNAVFLVAGAQVNAHLLATRSPRSLLRVGLVMLVVAGVALVVIVSLPNGGSRDGDGAADAADGQLELRPGERAGARLDRPSRCGGHGRRAPRRQPVRIRSVHGPARRDRRQRHGPPDGSRDRRLRRGRRRSVRGPCLAVARPAGDRRASRDVGASLVGVDSVRIAEGTTAT